MDKVTRDVMNARILELAGIKPTPRKFACPVISPAQKEGWQVEIKGKSTKVQTLTEAVALATHR